MGATTSLRMGLADHDLLAVVRQKRRCAEPGSSEQIVRRIVGGLHFPLAFLDFDTLRSA